MPADARSHRRTDCSAPGIVPAYGARAHVSVDNGRMNPRRAKAAGLVASAFLIGAAFAGESSAAGDSAATRLLASALQDASAKGSVHEVGVAVSGRQKVTIVDDIATHEGRQDVNHYGNEQAQVLVVNGTAYLSGNRAALTGYFGFTASAAHKIGTRWVSVPRANRNYAELSVGLTLASAGRDQSVRLWDPATGQELMTLSGHAAPVHAAAFSPDGTILATGSHDGAIKLWHSKSQQEPGHQLTSDLGP